MQFDTLKSMPNTPLVPVMMCPTDKVFLAVKDELLGLAEVMGKVERTMEGMTTWGDRCAEFKGSAKAKLNEFAALPKEGSSREMIGPQDRLMLKLKLELLTLLTVAAQTDRTISGMGAWVDLCMLAFQAFQTKLDAISE